MFDSENVLFGSEFDNTNFIKGVQGMADSLKGLAAQQENTNVALGETTENLTTVQKAIKNVQDVAAKGINLNVTDNGINQKLQQIKQNFASIFSGANIQGLFNPAEITQFNQQLANTKGQFQQIQVAVQQMNQKLLQLEPGTQEFIDLSKAVQAGNVVLNEYNNLTKQAIKNTTEQDTQIQSIISRVRAYNNQLVALTEAGKAGTAEFRATQDAAALLNREYQQILLSTRELGSETRLLDFGLSSIQAAAAGYQTFIGIQELFGIATDNDAEAQKKLLSILNLVFGLQQLTQLLSAKGIIVTTGARLATDAYAIANEFLATSFGEAATAATVLRGALITTGIGALVVGLGFLVSKLIEWHDENERIAADQKLINDVVSDGNKEAGKQIANVRILTAAVKDGNLPMADRLKAVKELQKEFPDYFKNLSQEAILTGDITKETNALTASIEAAARARAAKGKIDELEAQRLDIDFQKQKIISTTNRELAEAQAKTGTGTQIVGGLAPGAASQGLTKTQVQEIIKNRRDLALNDQNQKQADLQRQEDFLTKFVGLDQLAKVTETKDPKEKKAKTPPENEFQRRLDELKLRLAALAESTFQSDDTIRAKISAEFNKSLDDILKAVREKRLTLPQAHILQEVLINIDNAEFEKQSAELKAKLVAAQKEINNAIEKERQAEADARIANIKDEFERQKQEAYQQAVKSNVDLLNNKTTDLKLLQDKFNEGIYGDPNSEQAKLKLAEVTAQIEGNYDKLFADLSTYTNNKLLSISADAFQSTLNSIKEQFGIKDTDIQAGADKADTSEAQKFLRKEITYQQYIDAVKKLDHDALIQKLENDKLELQSEQDLINARIATVDISDEELTALIKQYDVITAQIAALDKQITAPEAPTGKNKFDKIITDYEGLAGTILDFFSTVNDAEQNSLNRSIALQQQRVDNARFIAERGNAEYLALEQKRLDDLQRKQASAAQKQIAINNAVAVSEALVAIIKSIAEGGVAAPVFVAEAIALIAAGYKFVSSLQPVSTSFYEGTPYVQQGNHKSGRDTIPARVNIGEAIIPTDTNAQYSEAVRAIYHKTVPASVLNEFVARYPNQRIPSTDYARLGIATDFKMSEANETNKKLDKVYNVLEMIYASSDTEPVKVGLDANGFTVAWMKNVRREKLKRRM